MMHWCSLPWWWYFTGGKEHSQLQRCPVSIYLDIALIPPLILPMPLLLSYHLPPPLPRPIILSSMLIEPLLEIAHRHNCRVFLRIRHLCFLFLSWGSITINICAILFRWFICWPNSV